MSVEKLLGREKNSSYTMSNYNKKLRDVVMSIKLRNKDYEDLLNDFKYFDLYTQLVLKTCYAEEYKSSNYVLLTIVKALERNSENKEFIKLIKVVKDRILNKKIKFLDIDFYIKLLDSVKTQEILSDVKKDSYELATKFLENNKFEDYDYLYSFINYVKEKYLILDNEEFKKLLNSNERFFNAVSMTPELLFTSLGNDSEKSIISLIYKSFYSIGQENIEVNNQRDEKSISSIIKEEKKMKIENKVKIQKTVYEQFSQYTQEDIDSVLDVLLDDEIFKEKFIKRYGYDFKVGVPLENRDVSFRNSASSVYIKISRYLENSKKPSDGEEVIDNSRFEGTLPYYKNIVYDQFKRYSKEDVDKALRMLELKKSTRNDLYKRYGEDYNVSIKLQMTEELFKIELSLYSKIIRRLDDMGAVKNENSFCRTVFKQFSKYDREDVIQALNTLSKNPVIAQKLKLRYGSNYDMSVEKKKNDPAFDRLFNEMSHLISIQLQDIVALKNKNVLEIEAPSKCEIIQEEKNDINSLSDPEIFSSLHKYINTNDIVNLKETINSLDKNSKIPLKLLNIYLKKNDISYALLLASFYEKNINMQIPILNYYSKNEQYETFLEFASNFSDNENIQINVCKILYNLKRYDLASDIIMRFPENDIIKDIKRKISSLSETNTEENKFILNLNQVSSSDYKNIIKALNADKLNYEKLIIKTKKFDSFTQLVFKIAYFEKRGSSIGHFIQQINDLKVEYSDCLDEALLDSLLLRLNEGNHDFNGGKYYLNLFAGNHFSKYLELLVKKDTGKVDECIKKLNQTTYQNILKLSLFIEENKFNLTEESYIILLNDNQSFCNSLKSFSKNNFRGLTTSVVQKNEIHNFYTALGVLEKENANAVIIKATKNIKELKFLEEETNKIELVSDVKQINEEETDKIVLVSDVKQINEEETDKIELVSDVKQTKEEVTNKIELVSEVKQTKEEVTNKIELVSEVKQTKEEETDKIVLVSDVKQTKEEETDKIVLVSDVKQTKEEEVHDITSNEDNVELLLDVNNQTELIENKDSYLKILHNNLNFTKSTLELVISKIDNPKDLGILCMAFGYYDEKVFTTNAIATILSESEEYVLKVLNEFCETYNLVHNAKINNMCEFYEQKNSYQRIK